MKFILYIIGAFVALFVAAWVIAIIVCGIQWVIAAFIWVFQVFLMPLFIYFAPATIMVLIVFGVYLGTGIAVRNYFSSLRANVFSEGLLGKVTRNYIISMLTLFITVIYLLFAATSIYLIFIPSEMFVLHVAEYYNTIQFPAYRIIFPFWKDNMYIP